MAGLVNPAIAAPLLCGWCAEWGRGNPRCDPSSGCGIVSASTPSSHVRCTVPLSQLVSHVIGRASQSAARPGRISPHPTSTDDAVCQTPKHRSTIPCVKITAAWHG